MFAEQELYDTTYEQHLIEAKILQDLDDLLALYEPPPEAETNHTLLVDTACCTIHTTVPPMGLLQKQVLSSTFFSLCM